MDIALILRSTSRPALYSIEYHYHLTNVTFSKIKKGRCNGDGGTTVNDVVKRTSERRNRLTRLV